MKFDHNDMISACHQRAFSQKVLKWYAQHGRQALPWKDPLIPYRIWLSEIMLQQTQVTTVIPYFHKFLLRFPTLEVLAQSSLDEVLTHWAGLGYYARARNLHKTAQILAKKFDHQFPQDLATLMSLPGIGRSTAGAILAQAYEIRAPILDGNVKRVLWRFHGDRIPSSSLTAAHNKLWEIAEQYTPKKQVGAYTQAMMDLGALICTRSQPQCTVCPIRFDCYAFNKNTPNAFPVKFNKKKIPTQQIHMLCVIKNQQEILLEKRPQHGIWGGLFSLPEFLDVAEAKIFLAAHLQKLPPIKPYISLRHTFTHFHLMISTSLITLPKVPPTFNKSSWHWVKLSEITHFGLPAPIKKILKSATMQLT